MNPWVFMTQGGRFIQALLSGHLYDKHNPATVMSGEILANR